MPLRMNLKPGERLILGGAVIRNGDARSELLIENEVPVLREADVLSPRTVRTACEWVYLALQLAYVDPEGSKEHRNLLQVLIDHVRRAAPLLAPELDEVAELAASGRLYPALKSAKRLIQREKELTDHVA
jgi:flagellar protein FlbT